MTTAAKPAWKIASWNVNSLKVRLGHVQDWLAEHQPDVLCLQETKQTDQDFPVDAIRECGYQAHYSGQKTYNGVATLSRNEARLLATALPDYDDPQKRLLAVEVDGVCVLNLYVPNGSETGSEKYAYKLDWLARLDDYTERLMQEHTNLILTGDFNIAPADADVHDPEEWRDKILCSEPERAALNKLMDKGMQDTFRLFDQDPNTFSWWDYRAAGFRRNRGLRIDLILASKLLAGRCRMAFIDKAPRTLERPSDHTPVAAVFEVGS
ncbi:MAG: exodeoxyribonuclease III [Gammaproteobacteria bacterium]